MTQEQFVQKFRHEIGGLLLDAATNGLKGAELSMFLRSAYAKIDVMLRQAHVEATTAATTPDAAARRPGGAGQSVKQDGLTNGR